MAEIPGKGPAARVAAAEDNMNVSSTLRQAAENGAVTARVVKVFPVKIRLALPGTRPVLLLNVIAG